MKGILTEVNFGAGALDTELVRATLNGRAIVHPQYGRGTLERGKGGELVAGWNDGSFATFTEGLSGECRVELREGDFENAEPDREGTQKPQAASSASVATQAASSGAKPVAEMTHEERVAAVMKCPAWARPSVAPIYSLGHLWPVNRDAELREARKAQLRAIGKAVSDGNGAAPVMSQVPAGQEARAAQLRAAGKAAMSGR